MAAGFVGFGVGKFIPEEDALNVGKNLPNGSETWREA